MLRSARRLSTALARDTTRNLPQLEALGWRATRTAEALGAEIQGADLSKIGDVEVCSLALLLPPLLLWHQHCKTTHDSTFSEG